MGTTLTMRSIFFCAWRCLINNKVATIIIALCALITTAVSMLLASVLGWIMVVISAVGHDHLTLLLIFALCSLPFIIMLQALGALYSSFVALCLTRDKSLLIKDVLQQGKKIPYFIVVNFLYCWSVMLGLVAGVIPGIILLVRWQFYPYILLDGDHNPAAIFQKSWALTRGYTFQLVGLRVILLSIIILGGVTIIGVFITTPFALFVDSIIYNCLLKNFLPNKECPWQNK